MASNNNNDFATLTPPGQVPKIDSIFDVSAKFLAEFRLWLEQNPPAIGIKNILGFSQFTAQAASPVATQETTSSTAYVDLATVGPTLTNLPDGQYIIVFGCAAANNTAGIGSRMSVQVNGTAAVDADNCLMSGAENSGLARVVVKTLNNSGNNTVTAKYRCGNAAATAFFQVRWLVALKFTNA